MAMLDPYGNAMLDQGGMFQQNPQQLMQDNYGPPQAPQGVNTPQYMDPQMSAYGAAIANIGDIIGNRAPSQNIGSAYMQAKSSNDRIRQNAANSARQAEQDELQRRYKESQISKNEAVKVGIDPANVREYQFFEKLSDDDKEEYLTMKRATQQFQQGDVRMQTSQLGGTAAPLQTPGLEGTQPEIQQAMAVQEGETQATIAAATNAQKVSNEYFSRLQPINEGIGRLDRAIELIDSGADTGPISQYFPSFTAASQELDNLQNQLGLDVVSNTTFGALSAGELKLALATAIPDNMNEKALRKWLVEKRDAQSKLKDYLEGAAMYLSRPGNTQAGWITEQREREKLSNKPSKDLSDGDLLLKYGVK